MNNLRSTSFIYTLLASLALLLTSIGCSKSSGDLNITNEKALETGLEALRVFDFARSYEVFEHLHASMDTKDENWPLVTYSYGISSWLKTPISREGVELAVDLLTSLTEQAPNTIYTASALLDLGRITEISNFRGDTTDVVAARAYYERVRAEFPNSDMSTRATLFLAQTYAQTLAPEDINKAISLLETCISEQTDHTWIGNLGSYLGDLYSIYLNQPDQAIDPLVLATEAGLPRHADTDATLWRIGVLAQNAGRDLLAAKMYTRIIQEYPRTVFRSVSRERLEQIQLQYPDEQILPPEAP